LRRREQAAAEPWWLPVIVQATIVAGKNIVMKRPWYLVPAAIALVTCGCVSSGRLAPPPTGQAVAQSPETSARADLKTRLDDIIQNKVRESDIVGRLGTFALENYDIQDPGTFWGHRAVASAGSSCSEYYFTYRNTYVILLLKDTDKRHHTCIDARFFPRRSPDYELTTGRVQVDGRPIDEEIIVLVNRKWPGRYSTDILAAFKPNVESGKIEKLAYASIIIYREE
jgi:hypothetical protein